MRARAAALTLAAALAAAGPGRAASTGEAAAALEAAEAALEDAEGEAARLAALSQAVTAAEAALAAMREGLRRAAVREADLAARAESDRRGAQTALGRLAGIARAPLAAQAAQPAGPLAAARGAWLAAALGPERVAQARALERARAEAARAETRRRAAWADMRGVLAGLQAVRGRAAAGRGEAAPDLAPARAALEAFAAAGRTAEAETPRPPARPAAPGRLPPPAAGPVVTPFGAVDRIGQTIPGVEIAVPPWTEIRAPRAATVRYAGPAAGRGQAVILEPDPGRLLILAGFDGLSVQAGEIALEGAALGHLGVIAGPAPDFPVEAPARDGALSPQLLYVEVREDGVPVDPARWFALPKGEAATP